MSFPSVPRCLGVVAQRSGADEGCPQIQVSKLRQRRQCSAPFSFSSVAKCLVVAQQSGGCPQTQMSKLRQRRRENDAMHLVFFLSV